jgi:hypothetical protein
MGPIIDMYIQVTIVYTCMCIYIYETVTLRAYVRVRVRKLTNTLGGMESH